MMRDPFWPDFNDQWDYQDVEGTEKAFRTRLDGDQAKSDDSYRLQLMTQIARTWGLRGDFDQAHKILDKVEGEMEPGSLVELRYLLERGRAFNSDGKKDQALALFHKAVEAGQAIGTDADFYTVDALHMVAIAVPSEESLAWNLKAIEAAEQSANEHARNWMASLLNNAGWSLIDEERNEEALELFKKALVHREKQGEEYNIRSARWCIASTRRRLGRIDEALEILFDLLESGETEGFTEEEIGECLKAQGKEQEAETYFKMAYEKRMSDRQTS